MTELTPDRLVAREEYRQTIADIIAGRYVVKQTVEYIADEYDEAEGKNT